MHAKIEVMKHGMVEKKERNLRKICYDSTETIDAHSVIDDACAIFRKIYKQ